MQLIVSDFDPQEGHKDQPRIEHWHALLLVGLVYLTLPLLYLCCFSVFLLVWFALVHASKKAPVDHDGGGAPNIAQIHGLVGCLF